MGLAEDLDPVAEAGDPVAEAGEGLCEAAVPANTGCLSVIKLSNFFYQSINSLSMTYEHTTMEHARNLLYGI